MYHTQPLSIEFWDRLLSRLDAEYESSLGKLSALLKPVTATIDTSAEALQQVKKQREQALALAFDLENLQLLKLAMNSQLRHAIFSTEIPATLAQAEALRKIHGLLTQCFTGLGLRGTVELDMQSASRQFHALRSAGQGESANADRMRLRSLQWELPVIDAEDAQGKESEANSLRTAIDELDIKLQSLRANTFVTLQFPEPQALLLQRLFGLKVAKAVAVASQE